jgi:tRNA(Ile)-lysidine synthase
LLKRPPPLFEVTALSDLTSWVGALVRQEELFSPGDRVLVAVSGGPDSMALLQLLNRLSPELDLALGVAHFHHGLRGQESDEDAAFVAQEAQKLGLPFHLGGGDVGKEATERKISLQMAARGLRLHFLQETRRVHGYQKLALGHTADDQVEQFFLRLLRGTGLDGLKGMRFRSPEGVVRPLLAVGKEVLMAWLESENIPYRQDASNWSRRYLRNRVRLDLLPELARRYNPRLKTAIWRLMSLLQEDEQLLASLVTQAWGDIGRMVSRDFAVISLPKLVAVPIGLQKRILRYAMGKLNLEQETTSGQMESLLALARAQKSGGQVSLGLCQVARAGHELHIRRHLLPPPANAETVISTPGDWHTAEGWRFLVSRRPVSEAESALPVPTTVHLDGEQVALPLRVRYFRPGDRFWPQGASGTRKLQDFLVDSKIPRWLRPHLPLVESRGRIVWVVGFRVAEPAKITPATRKVLTLQAQPASPYTTQVWESMRALQSEAEAGERRRRG